MYAHNEDQMIMPDDFFLPFGGRLNPENRWVVLAQMIPWGQFERDYARTMKSATRGQRALSVRMAFGALYIQQKKGLSDRDTVEEITENPYLQYFIGLPEFQETPPFDPSMMTHFRKRLGADTINEMNETILQTQHTRSQNDAAPDTRNDDDDDHHQPPTGARTTESSSAPIDDNDNQGKLLLDATCVPADIAYPTDLGLLNTAREQLEQMIDILHAPHRGARKKPRDYRRKARKQYLSIAKQRQPGAKKIRKAVGRQLGYVARDLNIINALSEYSPLSGLPEALYQKLLVISELYRQQRAMHETRTKRIEHRIVSISQPHVRPIVRNKAKARTEFGAKMAISLVDGYAYMDTLSWDSYNEAKTLRDSVAQYKHRFGHYPAAIMADQIYRNRENRQFCKSKGIRLSGPALGRPSKEKAKMQDQRAAQDAAERNAIEAKFGEGKRHYGMGLISTRLQQTSETVISLQLLVMNLERSRRLRFCHFFARLFGRSLKDLRAV